MLRTRSLWDRMRQLSSIIGQTDVARSRCKTLEGGGPGEGEEEGRKTYQAPYT
jgi:hypothetical protein